MQRILNHIGEPAEPPRISPARPGAAQSCSAFGYQPKPSLVWVFAAPSQLIRPCGTTHPSRPYPTGTPWPNRNPSTSSTSGCSGSHLPSPGRAGDVPLPVPVVIVLPPNPARHPPERRFAPRRTPPARTRPRALCPCRAPSFEPTFPLTPAAVRLDFQSPGSEFIRHRCRENRRRVLERIRTTWQDR